MTRSCIVSTSFLNIPFNFGSCIGFEKTHPIGWDIRWTEEALVKPSVDERRCWASRTAPNCTYLFWTDTLSCSHSRELVFDGEFGSQRFEGQIPKGGDWVWLDLAGASIAGCCLLYSVHNHCRYTRPIVSTTCPAWDYRMGPL